MPLPQFDCHPDQGLQPSWRDLLFVPSIQMPGNPVAPKGALIQTDSAYPALTRWATFFRAVPALFPLRSAAPCALLRIRTTKSAADSHSSGARWFPFALQQLSTKTNCCLLAANCCLYAMISVIVPAPTVRPPSRIAKRRPFSMATGVISSISRLTLSPGITISVPPGKVATPVTSVVRT